MSQLLELVVPWLQVDDEDVLHPVLLSQLQHYCTAPVTAALATTDLAVGLDIAGRGLRVHHDQPGPGVLQLRPHHRRPQPGVCHAHRRTAQPRTQHRPEEVKLGYCTSK